MTLTNWGGTYAYRAATVHRPGTMHELCDVVSRLPRVRVLGSRHSFTDIGDAPELVSLAQLPEELEVDERARTVTVSGATRYGDLAGELDRRGWALANLASLPHISVAGAIATATHGSGAGNGNLATSVRALELVTSDGERVRLAAGEAGFDGAVVSLGALGAVTRVTLAIEPTYTVAQHVFEDVAWDALLPALDSVLRAAYSVSVFTRWERDAASMVWLKARAGEQVPGTLLGAAPAQVDRHPIVGLDPVNCTPQLGRPGPWMERLPHFRLGFTPSAGDEIQSEYHLSRDQGAQAVRALLELAPVMSGLVQVAEIRAIAADRLWMSPQYGRDTIAVHFTWVPDPPAVSHALGEIEPALLELGARPHWGKLFLAQAGEVAARYDRAEEFIALAARFDPRGAFVNPWLERVLLGARAR